MKILRGTYRSANKSDFHLPDGALWKIQPCQRLNPRILGDHLFLTKQPQYRRSTFTSRTPPQNVNGTTKSSENETAIQNPRKENLSEGEIYKKKLNCLETVVIQMRNEMIVMKTENDQQKTRMGQTSNSHQDRTLELALETNWILKQKRKRRNPHWYSPINSLGIS